MIKFEFDNIIYILHLKAPHSQGTDEEKAYNSLGVKIFKLVLLKLLLKGQRYVVIV